jgi:hypothetical protein
MKHQADTPVIDSQLCLAAVSNPHILYGVLNIFIHESPTRLLLENTLGKLQGLYQEVFPTEELPPPFDDIGLCTIYGINTLNFDDGDIWKVYADAVTTIKNTVTAGDIGYNGSLSLWKYYDGSPRFEIAVQDPETYLAEQFEGESESGEDEYAYDDGSYDDDD